TIKNTIKGIQVTKNTHGVTLFVGAGEDLDDVVHFSCERGWWGLENLSAIPGTVGATPIQNVGAYGVEVAELIRTVSVYDPSHDQFLELSAEACQFSYRHSLFKETSGTHYVVLHVEIFLPSSRGPTL